MDTQITTPAQHSSMIELQKDSTYTAPDTESLCSERSDLQTVEKKQPTIAHLDEEQGAIEFKVVKNDQTKESMILLTGLKNLFQKQLPNMPKEYISRLAYDRNHVAMAVVRYPLIVVGGIFTL